MFDYVLGLTIVSVLIAMFGQMLFMMVTDILPSWETLTTISGITSPITFAVAYATDPQLQQLTMPFIISSILLSIPFVYHFIAHVVPKIKENRNPLNVALRNREIEFNNRMAHYINLGMRERDARSTVESEFAEQSQQLLNTYKQLGV